MKALLLLSCATLLSGCVVVPQKVMSYDARCDVVYDRMTLAVRPLDLGGGGPGSGLNCSENCGPLLVAIALIPPASVLVSGSIVVVRNTVHWAERERECAA